MPHLTTLLTLTLLALLPLTTLAATIYKGDGTFYSPSVGLGSCGHQNQDSEHVAALATGAMTFYNPSNPNDNPVCGHKVKVWESGKPNKSVTVAIVDTCPGCQGKYDLDLSPAAFDVLEDAAVGRIKIAWEFVDPFRPGKGPLAKKAPGGKVVVGQEFMAGPEGGRDQEVLLDAEVGSQDEL